MSNHNIYVTGHKHPDSDSICSAIAFANLLNKTGSTAIACRQGPLNEETKFIFSLVKCFSFIARSLQSKGKPDRKGDENCDQFLSYLRYG